MHTSKLKVIVACFLFGFFVSNGVIGQKQDVSLFAADVDPNTAYCFRFTWMGPKWDNSSQLNATSCEDFGQIPCKEPLVYTYDSSPPNTTYMWNNYDLSQITCRLTKGEVCTKWVKYYADEVEFITYMCSKYSVDGKPRTDWEGCEADSSTNKTFTNEVCACRSATGVEPCNYSSSLHTPFKFLLIVGVTAVLAARWW